jgi:hypothetical protein
MHLLQADVQLPSKALISGLWKAVKRHGGGMWYFRTSTDAWVVRYSETPVSGRPNPLPLQYKRDYRSPYACNRWSPRVDELKKGKTITLPSQDQAKRFAISARYHLRKTPDFPKHKVTVSPYGKKWNVRLVITKATE